MNFQDREEMIALAGEYALGALAPEERHAVEAELRRNPDLAAAVAQWNDRLLAIAPPPLPVEPAADLWARIERDLPGKALRREPAGLWNSLAFWRTAGFVAMAASVLLAVRLFSAAPDAAGPQYLAVLQAQDAGAHWLVEIDASTVRLRPLSGVSVGAGKAIQFWTKPEGAAGPTSLGLVPADRPSDIPVSALPALGPNQLFEVTLEPEGGSTIGRPTGPILAVGKAVRL